MEIAFQSKKSNMKLKDFFKNNFEYDKRWF